MLYNIAATVAAQQAAAARAAEAARVRAWQSANSMILPGFGITATPPASMAPPATPAPAPAPAPTPAPTPAAPAPTPNAADNAQAEYWRQKAAAEAAAREAALNQNLASAKAMIETYGMGALWGGMDKYIRAGYTDLDTINMMLSNDSAYQQAYYDRFPAVKTIRELNEDRLAKGMPIIAEPTAAGYVELEKAYRQALVGLPEGTYGSADDVATWIVNDVKPTEVANRVTTAKNYINYNANSSIKQQLRSIYGMTDAEMAAYVLSPDRTLEALQSNYAKRMAQATVGGAGIDSGLSLSDSLRDQISENEQFGNSYANTLANMQQVREIDDAYARLGRLSGVKTTTDELVTDQFGLQGAADVAVKKKSLASQERARFSGSSGITKNSLSAGRLAQ